jgi:hypothetical protein
MENHMSATPKGFARSRDEVEAEAVKAIESKEQHGRAGQWPGMAYEDGVLAALDWVLGDDDQAPMEG